MWPATGNSPPFGAYHYNSQGQDERYRVDGQSCGLLLNNCWKCKKCDHTNSANYDKCYHCQRYKQNLTVRNVPQPDSDQPTWDYRLSRTKFPGRMNPTDLLIHHSMENSKFKEPSTINLMDQQIAGKIENAMECKHKFTVLKCKCGDIVAYGCDKCQDNYCSKICIPKSNNSPSTSFSTQYTNTTLQVDQQYHGRGRGCLVPRCEMGTPSNGLQTNTSPQLDQQPRGRGRGRQVGTPSNGLQTNAISQLGQQHCGRGRGRLVSPCDEVGIPSNGLKSDSSTTPKVEQPQRVSRAFCNKENESMSLSNGLLHSGSDFSSPHHHKGYGRGRGRLTPRFNETENSQDFLPPPQNASFFVATKSEYKYKVDKLNRQEMNLEDSYTILKAYDFENYYIIITKKAEKQRRQLELMDLINEFIEDGNTSLGTYVPVQGDVIIAAEPKKYSVEYFRGYVERVLLDSYFEVRNIDNGKLHIVHVLEIKTVNDEIFELPPLGFEVKLHGVENWPKMILQTGFDTLMEIIRQEKTIFKATMVKPQKWKPTISLVQQDKDKTLLATRINALKKLRWEHYFDLGFKDDDSIIKRYSLDKYDVEHYLYSPSLPVGTDIKVRIIGIEPSGIDLLPTIVFEPLTPSIINMKQAFINQVNHYMNQVEPSNFYPAIQEMAFIKPPKGEPKAGQWLRCVCIELISGKLAMYVCVDTNERITTEGKTDHIFRRPNPEFMQTPRFVLFGILSDPEHTNFMLECFNRTFKVRKEVIIKILPKPSDDPKSKDKYKYECNELLTVMRELRPEWDFGEDKPIDSNFKYAPNSY